MGLLLIEKCHRKWLGPPHAGRNSPASNSPVIFNPPPSRLGCLTSLRVQRVCYCRVIPFIPSIRLLVEKALSTFGTGNRALEETHRR